jgi:hypothetical protein
MELTPEVKELYQKLLSELKKFGEVIVEEKKTSIHLKNRAGFAGVHPRKNYFILNIVSSTAINSSRITKREQVSKSRFHNELRIEKPEDIDDEVLLWLKEAYELMG